MSVMGIAINIGMLVKAAVAVLFIIIGKFMGQMRPNYFVGIKIPGPWPTRRCGKKRTVWEAAFMGRVRFSGISPGPCRHRVGRVSVFWVDPGHGHCSDSVFVFCVSKICQTLGWSGSQIMGK